MTHTRHTHPLVFLGYVCALVVFSVEGAFQQFKAPHTLPRLKPSANCLYPTTLVALNRESENPMAQTANSPTPQTSEQTMSTWLRKLPTQLNTPNRLVPNLVRVSPNASDGQRLGQCVPALRLIVFLNLFIYSFYWNIPSNENHHLKITFSNSDFMAPASKTLCFWLKDSLLQYTGCFSDKNNNKSTSCYIMINMLYITIYVYRPH